MVLVGGLFTIMWNKQLIQSYALFLDYTLYTQECQGGGLYKHEFQCGKCKDKFCRKCITENHRGYEHICMNCAHH